MIEPAWNSLSMDMLSSNQTLDSVANQPMPASISISELPSRNYQTSAPIFNPPASTSILQHTGPTAKTVEEMESEDFVRGLLDFQKSNGCFKFSDEEKVKTILGPSILSVVAGLKAELDNFDIILTITLVNLLEGQFQSCQNLWILMVRKAEEYISACSLGPKADTLMQEARNRIRVIPSVMVEVRNMKAIAASAIELQMAPVE